MRIITTICIVIVVILLGYSIYERKTAEEKILKIEKSIIQREEQHRLKRNQDSIKFEKRKKVLTKKRDSLKEVIENSNATH